MSTERVQKILAKAGIASRRKAEELITEGAVTINGAVAKLGDKAELGKDAIKVNGKLLQGAEEKVYLALHKPKGVISMLEDPEHRPTLKDFLGKVKARVFPIGRLDFNSDGLILLTNDGAFAEQLQRREDIPRVYHVKVKGHPDASMLAGLEKGAKIGNRMLRPHSVRIEEELGNKSRVEIAFVGAGAMDVKSLFDMKGFLVDKITRTAIGHITLRGITPGQYRLLKPSQVQALLEQPELGLKVLQHHQGEADERAKRVDRARDTRIERSRDSFERKRGGDRDERRGGGGGGFGGKRGGFGAKRGGGFGEKRGGGFGAKRGFGPKRDFGGGEEGTGGFEERQGGGFGRERSGGGGFGGEKRGGFGKRPGLGKRPGFGKREGGGFGDKREGRFGRPPRDRDDEGGGFRGKREGGFGGKRSGGFGEKRGGGFGGKRTGGFGGEKRGGGFGGPRGPRREEGGSTGLPTPRATGRRRIVR